MTSDRGCVVYFDNQSSAKHLQNISLRRLLYFHIEIVGGMYGNILKKTDVVFYQTK